MASILAPGRAPGPARFAPFRIPGVAANSLWPGATCVSESAAGMSSTIRTSHAIVLAAAPAGLLTVLLNQPPPTPRASRCCSTPSRSARSRRGGRRARGRVRAAAGAHVGARRQPRRSDRARRPMLASRPPASARRRHPRGHAGAAVPDRRPCRIANNSWIIGTSSSWAPIRDPAPAPAATSSPRSAFRSPPCSVRPRPRPRDRCARPIAAPLSAFAALPLAVPRWPWLRRDQLARGRRAQRRGKARFPPVAAGGTDGCAALRRRVHVSKPPGPCSSSWFAAGAAAGPECDLRSGSSPARYRFDRCACPPGPAWVVGAPCARWRLLLVALALLAGRIQRDGAGRQLPLLVGFALLIGVGQAAAAPLVNAPLYDNAPPAARGRRVELRSSLQSVLQTRTAECAPVRAGDGARRGSGLLAAERGDRRKHLVRTRRMVCRPREKAMRNNQGQHNGGIQG